jgi:hypothetical protein
VRRLGRYFPLYILVAIHSSSAISFTQKALILKACNLYRNGPSNATYECFRHVLTLLGELISDREACDATPDNDNIGSLVLLERGVARMLLFLSPYGPRKSRNLTTASVSVSVCSKRLENILLLSFAVEVWNNRLPQHMPAYKCRLTDRTHLTVLLKAHRLGKRS